MCFREASEILLGGPESHVKIPVQKISKLHLFMLYYQQSTAFLPNRFRRCLLELEDLAYSSAPPGYR